MWFFGPNRVHISNSTSIGSAVLCLRPGGAFWNSAIRPSVPWRSCLGYRHAGYQRCADSGPIRGHRPTAIFDWRRNAMPPSNCCWSGHIILLPPGRYLVVEIMVVSNRPLCICSNRPRSSCFACDAARQPTRRRFLLLR